MIAVLFCSFGAGMLGGSIAWRRGHEAGRRQGLLDAAETCQAVADAFGHGAMDDGFRKVVLRIRAIFLREGGG